MKKNLISGFQSAKNEAKKSFGDDRVFIEKFIVGPSHIEIQILQMNLEIWFI
jgi:propionyl-CoA carboxylase alpha chain